MGDNDDNYSDLPLSSIRNIGIIAHIDAGKTTLTERLLYYSGKTHRVGEVDSGNTVMDYLDEERERGITIIAAAASFPWRRRGEDFLVHLIDTPGHIDFTAEVERSLRVIDGAVVIFSGVEGVEAQSEKVWRQSEQYKVPKLAFINKLDRTGASFQRVLGEIKEKFPGKTALPMQIPLGFESSLSGVVDLVEMRLLSFGGEDGSEVSFSDIPVDLRAEAESAREKMIEDLADHSDSIAEAYLEGGGIDPAELRREIRRVVFENKCVPVFTGSARKNIGVQPVLNAIVDFLPSPEDTDSYTAARQKSGETVEIHHDDDDFCALAFKVVAGSGTSNLVYLRTYSGTLRLNDTILNSRTGEKFRVKRLLRLYARSVEAIDKAGPGDIVGIIAPEHLVTGDTLCAVNRPVVLEKITFPEPVMSIAVEPKSSKDRERLDKCLETICREDPTLRVELHESTGQQLLSGMGELHLEISCHRILHEFNVPARFGIPQVAFRETIVSPCEIRGVFDRMLGEEEICAEVSFSLEPVPRLESGIEVESEITRKHAPKSWIETAVSALENGLRTGGNWGYPLIYIRGRITGISADPDKASEGAVAGAVLNGLNEAIHKGTRLLEPLVKLEILSPENTVGEITGYLQARRAVIHGIDNLGESRRLHSEVPLSEMFGFSKALPKLSGGRASSTMEPCGYKEISSVELEKMVAMQRRGI